MSYQSEHARTDAINTLEHYMRRLWQHAGLSWGDDEQRDMVGLVDDLIQAGHPDEKSAEPKPEPVKLAKLKQDMFITCAKAHRAQFGRADLGMEETTIEARGIVYAKIGAPAEDPEIGHVTLMLPGTQLFNAIQGANSKRIRLRVTVEAFEVGE